MLQKVIIHTKNKRNVVWVGRIVVEEGWLRLEFGKLAFVV